MRHFFRLAAILLAVTFFHSASFGQTASGSFTVQGRLTDMNGVAVSNGTHVIVANVYAVGSANAIYTETDTVTTTDGVFSILLGANGSGKLTLNSNTNYDLGISVDGGAQLSPRIQIASVPSALTAHVADTANFALNITGNALASIDTALLGQVGSNIVTSVNGLHGNVVLQGGGNLGLTTSGDTIGLSFTGSGSGLSLPFFDTLSSGGSLLTLVNSGSGSAELLANSGTGNALDLTAADASALSASSNGTTATLLATNTGGGVGLNALSTMSAAIDATTNSSTSAALQLKNAGSASLSQLIQANSSSGTVMDLTTQGLTLTTTPSATGALLNLQNTSANASGNLIATVNATGNPLFTVTDSGAAMLNSSASTALSVTGTAGTAINAIGDNAGGAVLQLRNTSSDTSAGLISAVNATGGTAFSVASSGETNIQSTAATGLNVSSSAGTAITATTSMADSAALNVQNTASGSTAAKIVGGLSLVGPAGTGTILTGNLTATITNAYAKANSIILVTVTGGAGLAPIEVSSQGAGTFAVSLLNGVTLLTDLNFNYLIINQ